MGKKKIGIIILATIIVSGGIVNSYSKSVQAKQEKARIEKEESERKLEEERIEKERLEKEQLEKERIEKERIEKERIEKERLEKEKLEKEKIEKEAEEKKKEEAKKEAERKKLEEEAKKKETEKNKTNNVNKEVEQNFVISKLNEAGNKVVVSNFKTKGLSINENLHKIAAELNSKVFQGVQVTVKGIQNTNGKKIALIDLKDGSQKWEYTYFQGAMGGMSSETSLIDGFLQKGVKGSWIDGVKFTLNGKDVVTTAHVERLMNINYR